MNNATTNNATTNNTTISFSRKVLEKLDRNALVARYAMAKKDTDKNRVLDVLKESVKADNKARRKAFIDAASISTMEDFALNHFVMKEAVSVNKEGEICFTKDEQLVSMLSLDSEKKKSKLETIAFDARYKDVLLAFTNNLVRYYGGELDDDNARVTISRLHYGCNKWGDVNEYHFADENGTPLFDRKHLYEQLDALYAYLMGINVLHPRKSDLNYVLIGASNVVKKETDVVKTERPKAILDLVVNTIGNRLTNTGYVIETGAKEPKVKEPKVKKATKAEERAEEAISKKADPVVEPMTGAASPDAETAANATTISKITAPTAEQAAANKARKEAVKAANSLELSARVLAVLKAAGVNDANELAAMTEKELKAVKGIGKSAMAEISGFMSARGLTFKVA